MGNKPPSLSDLVSLRLSEGKYSRRTVFYKTQKDLDKDVKLDNEHPGQCHYYRGIGHIAYNVYGGQIFMSIHDMKYRQIGLSIRDAKYRDSGLDKQMLKMAILEIKKEGLATEIFAFSSEGDPFWSNVFGRAFAFRSPAYPRTASGYFCDINSPLLPP